MIPIVDSTATSTSSLSSERQEFNLLILNLISLTENTSFNSLIYLVPVRLVCTLPHLEFFCCFLMFLNFSGYQLKI